MKRCLLYAFSCALAFTSTISNAAVISPNYWEAPGGYTSSSSGPHASLGEQVNTYVGFNDSAYGSLYYALGDAGPIGTWDTFISAGPSLYAGTTGEMKNPLTYDASLSDFGAGRVTWSGSILSGSSNNVGTRFVMEVTDTSGIALGLTDSASLGLDASLGAVLDVSGDFMVTLSALMINTGPSFDYNNGSGVVTCNTGDWCHALPVYDRLAMKSPDERLYTSYSSGFYVEAVPVPAAVWLFGSGLIGLVGLARRKKV